jgi:hypothetical protein
MGKFEEKSALITGGSIGVGIEGRGVSRIDAAATSLERNCLRTAASRKFKPDAETIK